MLPSSFMTCLYCGARAAGSEYRSRSVVVCTIPDLEKPSGSDTGCVRQRKGRPEAGLSHLEPNSCQYRVVAGTPATRLFDAGAAAQVGLDLQPRSAPEPPRKDLQIFHHPRPLVAGFGD